jgi:hypothetical protein
MDHPQTPRILAPHLSNFQHKLVRILGKVVQLRGETAVIDAGGNVDVILNRVCGGASFFKSSSLCYICEDKCDSTVISTASRKKRTPVPNPIVAPLQGSFATCLSA